MKAKWMGLLMCVTMAATPPDLSAARRDRDNDNDRGNNRPSANNQRLTFVTPAPGAPSPLGPVVIENFHARNGALLANGRVNLPGGESIRFTTPVQMGSRRTTTNCLILSLVLGPLDLNLLGLEVHLDQVCLRITAERGPGNLLGNLLCSSSSGRNASFVNDLAGALNSVMASGGNTLSGLAVEGATGSFVNTIDYERLAAELTTNNVPVGTNECPILDLRIQELNLVLLGLRVETCAPVVLTIVAIPGPGNLLGNLFCQLARLLDGGPATNVPLALQTFSTLLGQLTGGLLPTLPTGLSAQSIAAAQGGAVEGQGGGGGGRPRQPAVCTVLGLVLGPVDLNLLGLQVHLDRVCLLVTAERGPGNLLGNLLCPERMNRRTGLLDLQDGLGSLTAAPELGFVPMTAAGPFALLERNAPPTECPILHLNLQQLNLFLLGLRIQTCAPIVLDITAIPGPGNLLGNLLCDVAGLLDPTP